MKKLLKYAIWIVIAVIAVKAFIKFVYPDITDVTPYLGMKKSEIEKELGLTFSDKPAMVKKIYEGTRGVITVDGTDDNSLGIIYIDKKQAGFHIDNRRYGMFGMKIGDAMIEIDKKLTYPYDQRYELLNDFGQGTSTAVFFYNNTKNDCLVIVANDVSNRVVALTYFKDGKRATEEFSTVFR